MKYICMYSTPYSLPFITISPLSRVIAPTYTYDTFIFALLPEPLPQNIFIFQKRILFISIKFQFRCPSSFLFTSFPISPSSSAGENVVESNKLSANGVVSGPGVIKEQWKG